jgi:hypothetical protein
VCPHHGYTIAGDPFGGGAELHMPFAACFSGCTGCTAWALISCR